MHPIESNEGLGIGRNGEFGSSTHMLSNPERRSLPKGQTTKVLSRMVPRTKPLEWRSSTISRASFSWAHRRFSKHGASK